jgi:Xaa-Pro aminopeptidase
MSFQELREKAWKIPGRFQEQCYGMVAHGVGMCDEWPFISYDVNDPQPQSGILMPGMTLCIESYMGEVGGAEGVKLEQQVLITEDGWQMLSSFPLEEVLLS